MKLAIKAELAYSFAPSTQVIANIEASQSSDQTILSESLDIQPQVQVLSDKTPHGDRSIRAAFSGEVTILYQAVVENHLRQLLPTSGRQHVWSDLPNDVLAFLLPSRFCPSDKFMRFAQREFGGAGDGVARVMAILEWIHRHVDYVPGVSNAETTRGADVRGPRGRVPRFHASGHHAIARAGHSRPCRQRLCASTGATGFSRHLRGVSREHLVADRPDPACADRGHRQDRQRPRCV